jgi:hypothetical protein
MKQLQIRNLIFEFRNRGHASRIAYTLLQFQCKTFDLSGLPDDLEKIHFVINIGSKENKFERLDPQKISAEFSSPYDANLSLFLQIQAILSKKLIVHGAILSKKKGYEIITGKGGVGKTFQALITCFEEGGTFKGDDLLLLDEGKVYPILRPLCIYPDHIANDKLSKYFKVINIKKRPLIISKIQRRICLYLDMYITTNGYFIPKIMSTTYSTKTFAYISPNSISLKVDTSPIVRCSIKSLPKDSTDKSAGTISEFAKFSEILSDFTPCGCTFEHYVKKYIS